ncbi:MAG: FG-GAP-like repeat-containing protein [Candidatus Cyclobacteriaceae bacterium M2_1C_046]
MKRIFTLIAALSCFIAPAFSQTFSEISAGDITSDFNSSRALAAGDYNNDGYIDIWVGYYGSANILYRNNGNNTFTAIFNEGVSSASHDVKMIDFDNDGWLDLFTLNWGTENSLHKNNGDGTFTKLSSTATPQSLNGSFDATWGDYDQDGYLDLFVSNLGDKNQLFRYDGSSFTEVALDTARKYSIMATWVDWNADNHLDLVVIDDNKSNDIYTNNGDGTFTKQTNLTLSNSTSALRSASWGHYNNDALPDLYAALSTINDGFIYMNTGSDFNVSSQTIGGGGFSTPGDIDNDGDLDIVMNRSGYKPTMLVNDGNGIFTSTEFGAIHGVPAQGSILVDINNDGLLDVIQGDYDQAFHTHVYLNTTVTSNNFITLNLEGVLGNTSALGAVVTIYTPDKTITRSIYNSTGQKSQNPSLLHVGLGTTTSINDIRIQWPDGTAKWYSGSLFTLNQINKISGIGPNLRAYKDNYLENKVTRGQSYDLWTYINNNESYASGAFTVKHYISTDSIIDGADIMLDSVNMEAIDAFNGRWAYINYTVPADLALGNYYLIVDVDANDEVTETKEEDNLVHYAIEVINYQVPNLSASTWLNRNSYNAGTAFDINTSRITNWADTAASNAELRYYISIDQEVSADDSLLYSNFFDFEANSYIELNPALTIPATIPVGSYYLITIIDPDNIIEEGLETDNKSATWFNVTANPVTPSQLSATAISTTRIDLTWKDNSTVETEYRVYRDGILIATLAADAQYYSDAAVSAGVEYSYTVEAYNTSGTASSGAVLITIDASTDAELLVNNTTVAPVIEGGFSIASAWGDYNNDGFEDLYVANYAETNFLYQNNGDGTFTKITGVAPVSVVGNSVNASWADFNNDGWIDLMVINYGEANNLYKNNGDGTFTDIATAAGVAASGDHGVTWGDYDKDGLIDLFIASTSGVNNNLYRNNGDETFTSVAISGMTDSGGNSINAIWFHANYDEWLDLFVVNENEANQLFMNNQDGTFSQVLSGKIVTDIEASFGVSVGDYDNNGYQDVYVVNKGQSNSLYRNYGWSFEKVNVGVGGGIANSESSTWADFDNDSDLDLFVANSGENNMLFRNNGDNSFTSLLVGAAVNDGGMVSTSSSWADVNKDGFMDLFVTNASSQNNLLYINATNANNYIAFTLKGIEANNSAIGSKVRIETFDGTNTQYQYGQVLSNTGSRGENSLTVEFGLGTKTVQEVFVRWPNDRYNYYDQLAINQTHILYGMGVDLIPSLSSSVKTVVKQGSDFNIDAWAYNQSEYPADSFKVSYYLSADTVMSSGDILLETVKVDSIDAYGSQYVGITKNTGSFPLGTYKLLMMIDSEFDQRETIEENNLIFRDLTITDQDFSDIQAWVGTELYSFNPGTKVDIFGQLYNNSEFDAPKVSFEMYFSEDNIISNDDTIIMTVDSVNLPHYSSYAIDTAYTIPTGTTQGDYYIILMADQDSLLLEGSETNNKNSAYIFVSDFPARPTDLITTVVSTSQIDLFWKDNSNNETSYTVVRDDVVIATLGADATSYSDNSVAIDVEYTYYVYATNSFGNSWQSNQATGLIANIPELLIPVTTGNVISDGGSSTGTAWGDYNNDGFSDLFITNTSGENNFLYQNNGDGSFTKITSGILTTSGGNSLNAAWADYNNDGWLDLYVVNSNQDNFLYKNNGDGTFTNTASSAGVLSGDMGAAWGDYDNDGWLDLYVTNGSGNNNLLYKNNGDGTFTSMSITGPTTSGGNSIMANWIDFDNDGWQDLFVVNFEEANQLFVNNGDGTFIKWNDGEIAFDVEASWSASWGDYNNDGYADLFVANKGQNNSLYRNWYGGSFEKITGDDIVQGGGNSEGSDWGDYDNDGDLDLYVANVFENNMLYQNDGNGTFTRIVLGAVVNEGSMISNSAAFADINNDGFLDLFVTNAAGQNNLLYLNSTNANNWVKVKLEGIAENSSAVGARVTLRTASNWQYRQVQTSTGARSQGSLELEIGLGNETIIDGLSIRWPNGYWKDYTVPTNQLTVIKGMGPEMYGYYEQGMAQKIKQGNDLSIEAVVQNTESYDIDSVEVRYYISTDSLLDGADLVLDSITVYNIGHMAQGFPYTTVTIPTDLAIGQYFLLMNVDPENKVRELDESNNLTFINLEIINYDLPDLGVSLYSNRYTYNAGTNFDYSINIYNSGDVDVLDVPVSIYLSTDNVIDAGDELLGTSNFDLPIDAQIVMDTTYALSGTLASGTYYLIGAIDESQVHEEKTETNNFSAMEFAIVDYPAAPTDLVANVSGEGQIDLTWTDNSNNELKFEVYSGEISNVILVESLAANTTAYTLTGLTADSTYTFYVAASNNAGLTYTQTDITLLATPTGLTTSISASSTIELLWSDNSAMETSYEVERNGTVIASTGADATIYNDANVEAQVEYTYRVKATNGIGESAFSAASVITILDTGGPVITVTNQPASHVLGSTETFTVEVTDDSGVQSVAVSYRNLTAANDVAFTQQTLTEATAGVYEFNVTDAIVDELGVAVVFSAYDIYDNLTTSDTMYVYTEYQSGDVDLVGLNPGTSQTDYIILSVPLNLQNKNANAVFSPYFGNYDPVNWRMFHYSTSSERNVEYNNGWTNIERGLGYWFLFEGTGNFIPLEAGDHSLTDGQPFTITLNAGWNQIGNPYLWNISWTDVLSYNGLSTAGGVVSEAYFYYGQYEPWDEWLSFEGAFVQASSTITLEIPYEKNLNIQGRKKNGGSESKGRIQEKEWQMIFEVKGGDVKNTTSGIGMNINADVSRDEFDRLTPPRFNNHLEVNFMHPEFSYPYFSRDVVPTEEQYTWDFTVESNVEAEDITISWDSQIAEGSDKKLILKDVEANIIIDMAEVSSYTFTNGEVRAFQVLYGSQQYIDEELSSITTEILQAYPNPFTNDIALPFVLKGEDQSYEVEMSIVSINGEKLLTLVEGKLTSGYYRYSWDGRLANGTELSPGIYIQQLIVKDGYNQEVYRIKLMKR